MVTVGGRTAENGGVTALLTPEDAVSCEEAHIAGLAEVLRLHDEAMARIAVLADTWDAPVAEPAADETATETPAQAPAEIAADVAAEEQVSLLDRSRLPALPPLRRDLAVATAMTDQFAVAA